MNLALNRLLPGIVAAALLSSCTTVSTYAPAARTQASQPSSLSTERLGRLTRALQDYVDQGRIAGAVVRIQQDGRPVYSQAVGWRDKEAGDPMREDSIFRIASQTKALTSVAILMLMDEGKLLLNDPVGKYLPEWSRTNVAVARPGGGYDVVPAKRPITIRDLLTHTAGISYGTGPAEKAWRDAGIFGWYFAYRDEPVSAVVSRMADLPMAAQPGEKFVYGYNTDILGVVVEKISGQTLEGFLNDRLIRPLGMNDTFFYAPPDKVNRVAAVYAADGNGIRRAPEAGSGQGGQHYGQGHYVTGPRVAFSGGAGLLSTASDYSRLLEMLRRGGEMDGRRYLSRHAVELMTTDHLNGIPYDPGMGFGLGFSIREDVGAAGVPGSKGEYGWGGAYHSQYWIDPKERMTIVYLIQLNPAGNVDDQGKLRSLIYQAID